jgi:hypothetical protein
MLLRGEFQPGIQRRVWFLRELLRPVELPREFRRKRIFPRDILPRESQFREMFLKVHPH